MKITSDGNKITVNKKTVTTENATYKGCRNVVFLDDVVVKFDTSRSGIGKQCEAEGINYMRIKPNDKKYFGTVLAYGEFWLVMKKYDFYKMVEGSEHFTPKQYKSANVTLERLKNKYDLNDMHTGNIGILKSTGKLIIFDFGL